MCFFYALLLIFVIWLWGLKISSEHKANLHLHINTYFVNRITSSLGDYLHSVRDGKKWGGGIKWRKKKLWKQIYSKYHPLVIKKSGIQWKLGVDSSITWRKIFWENILMTWLMSENFFFSFAMACQLIIVRFKFGEIVQNKLASCCFDWLCIMWKRKIILIIIWSGFQDIIISKTMN